MKKFLLLFTLISTFFVNAQFWTEKATGFTTPSRALGCISLVNTDVIWASAFDNSDPGFPDRSIMEFTRSTDGGNTWTPGSIDLGAVTPNLGISSITAVSATTAWISAYPEGDDLGGVWKTTDGGATWAKQTTALFNNFLESYANFVYFWDANNGVAGGDPENGEFEIYTTSDGGTTWTRVAGANIPDPDADGEYGYDNRYFVSGNTIWFGTDLGRIYKSTDKGLTWTVSQTPSADFGLDKFTFSDANKGLLMIYSETPELYKTTDGGSTWNLVTTTGYYFNTDVAYIPGTSKVVSGNAAAPLGSSYSLDDGATWTTIDNVYHGTMVFLNDTFGFSSGLNTSSTVGGIFKYTGDQLAVANFNTNKNISVYPNPTNGMVQIDSDSFLIKNAAIFDVLGKQVYSTNLLEESNKASLDLSALQTGLYLLKVTSDSGKTNTMKIMKN